MLDRVFDKLQVEQIIRIELEVVSLDSASVKVHLEGTNDQEDGPQAVGKSHIWLPRMFEQPNVLPITGRWHELAPKKLD